jgi:large subunit ribosomal protein L10
MDRAGKKDFVQNFSESISQNECMILVRHSGIDCHSMTSLRRSAHSEGVSFRVVKNTLLERSLQEASSEISQHIKGPMGVFLSQDPVAAAKVASTFSKKNKDRFVALVGIVSGKVVQSRDIGVLASLPGPDQMRAMLLRVISAPATSLARTLKEPSASVARVISSYNQKRN